MTIKETETGIQPPIMDAEEKLIRYLWWLLQCSRRAPVSPTVLIPQGVLHRHHKSPYRSPPKPPASGRGGSAARSTPMWRKPSPQMSWSAPSPSRESTIGLFVSTTIGLWRKRPASSRRRTRRRTPGMEPRRWILPSTTLTTTLAPASDVPPPPPMRTMYDDAIRLSLAKL